MNAEVSTPARGLWSASGRIALGATVVAVLLLAARSVANLDAQRGLPLLAIAVVFAPAALYFTLRAPAVFPFGVYLALIPLDAILAVSSGATLTRLFGIFTAAAFVVHMIVKRRVLAPPEAWWAWLAWLAWTSLSLLWTLDVPTARGYYGSILQLFLMMTVLAIYPFTRRDLRFALFAIVATGFALGLYSLAQYHAGAFGSDSRISIVNAAGVVIDQNYFAASFVLPAALALGAVLYARSVAPRVAAGVALLPMLFAIFQSGSRGGFVAIAIVFAYFALRSRHRIAIGALALGALALTAFVPSIWERFLNDPTAASGSGRTYIWMTGLASWKEHWLFGSGVGSFPAVYDQNVLNVFQAAFQDWGRPPHSLIVGVLIETGVVGLVLVLNAWFRSFRQAASVPASSELYPVRLALEAAILGLFASSLFIDPAYIKFIWLANTLPMMLVHVAGRAGATVPARARLRRPRVRSAF